MLDDEVGEGYKEFLGHLLRDIRGIQRVELGNIHIECIKYDSKFRARLGLRKRIRTQIDVVIEIHTVGWDAGSNL